MHVLMIVRGFAADGPGRLIGDLLAAWPEEAGRVSVAALEGPGPGLSMENVYRRETTRLGGEVRVVPGSLRSLGTAIGALAKVAGEIGATHLHAHLLRADLIGREVARRTGLPYVVTEHGIHAWSEKSWLLGPVVRTWYRHRRPGGFAIAAVSAKVRRDLLRAGIHPSHVYTIANGIDLGRFRVPMGAEKAEARRLLGLGEEDSPVLGLVGGLTARKDPLAAVAALEEVRGAHPQAVLLVAGEGLMRRRAEAAAGPGVRFLGWRADPRPVYTALDLLLHPAVDEPFGLVLGEALACGVAVVARAGAGPEDLLPPPPGGFLAGCGQRAFAAASRAGLEAVLGSPHHAANLARARAEAQFDVSRAVGEYINLYRLVSGR